jgi:hypothetical protein
VSSFGDALDRLGSVLGVLGPVGAVVIGILRWKHVIGPHTTAPELITGSIVLIVAGFGFIVWGWMMRRDLYHIFDKNRGSSSSVRFLIGMPLLVIGIIGLAVV